MSDNLRILRELNNYAQEYIAEVLGISQNTYSRLEKNPEKLSAEQARKLAQLYSVTLDELLSEERPVISFCVSKNLSTDEVQALKEEVPFLREQNLQLWKRIDPKTH